MKITSREDWIHQAGAIPLRRGRDGLEVLLVTTRSGRWIVPKGMIEPGLSPRQAAQMEALEEAGVRGLVSRRRLGWFEYSKRSRVHRVELFTLLVREQLRDWHESSRRRRRWVPLHTAASLLAHRPALSLVVRRLAKTRRATVAHAA